MIERVQVVDPSWETLARLVAGASDELLICSPFISSSGVDRVFDAVGSQRPQLTVFTRLSPSDWSAGISDPVALLALLDLWDSTGLATQLLIAQRLHAKLYSSDRSIALVGSANLSEGGFGRNVELLLELTGEGANTVVDHLLMTLSSHARQLSLADLREWISRSQSAVRESQKIQSAEAEILREAQRDLDRLLGHGGGRVRLLTPTARDLEEFAGWAETNPTLSGAETIVDRHTNHSGQNLQGHVKQCFFALSRFFSHQAAWISPLSDRLGSLGASDIFQPDEYPEFLKAWLQHVDEHATDFGEDYDYSVLRGILPPSLGGTRLGGGGGSSTLKRMMPLVARYTHEEREEL